MTNGRSIWTRTLALAGCTAALAGALAFSTGCAPATTSVSISPEGSVVSQDETGITVVYGASQQARTITVSGIGAVEVAPDTAKVNLQVLVQGDDAQKVQEEAAGKVAQVQATLAAYGVAGKDIATSNVNLYPIYDYSEGKEKIVGYQMGVTITVDNLPVESAGQAIADATSAGANAVNGVSYFVSDYDARYAEALEAALAAAVTKAQALAEAAGDNLGGVVDLVEGYENQRYRSEKVAATEDAAPAAAMGGTVEAEENGSIDIDPGTVKIEANVTVTFELTTLASA